MTQAERQIYLLKRLLAEQPQYQSLSIPETDGEQKKLLRSLFNVRPPATTDAEFLTVQNAYLQAETAAKGITDIAELPPAAPGLYLWQGDITTLRCDAIVNAANSGLTGCYTPCHACIDNCIHTYAGVQLRLECAKIRQQQGQPEPTGRAQITKAYNLPCRYVLHTVGPIISRRLTQKDEALLAECYKSCLALARAYGLKNLAFCCISTGEFHFPNQRAAEIAVETVQKYREDLEVIFNVFKILDQQIYQRLLQELASC